MVTKNIWNGPFHTIEELSSSGITLDAIPNRPATKGVLMCEPTFFQVIDVKTPFMERHINAVRNNVAQTQWLTLKETYEKLGCPVKLITPGVGREDMCFTANQVLLGVDKTGKPYAVCAEMVHESRQKEVPYFAQWFSEQGYRVLKLKEASPESPVPYFEGQGDAIWHPGKQFLWGGFGLRTQEKAYDLISKLINVPIIKLHLINPNFYHLDVAFHPIDSSTTLVYPQAIDAEGLRLIKWAFKNVVEVPAEEAFNFVCNCLVIGKHVVLQQGSVKTCRTLKELGYEPCEVNTSEFMKSGGSACCLIMRLINLNP